MRRLGASSSNETTSPRRDPLEMFGEAWGGGVCKLYASSYDVGLLCSILEKKINHVSSIFIK